jgi:hypothetical protein
MNSTNDQLSTKPAIVGNNVLPAVFVAITRYDARDKMMLGEDFEAPRNLSKFNRNMISFWMKEYGYVKSKSRHGYDLYKPVLNGR